MKLPWNDPRSNKFATSIGLITSNGPHGQNKVRSFHIGDKPPIVTHYVTKPFPTTKYRIVNERDTKEREEENNPNEK
jgi:hypothetical protein